MEIDRIDFGKNKECYRCHRVLKAKAYVVLNCNEEIFFGTECIKENFPIIDNNIPNFTRAGIENKSNHNNKINKKNEEKNNTENIKRAIEYIRLRCELLIDFHGIEDKDISDIYSKYRFSKLEENDKKYIDDIIEYHEKIISKFGYKNLMACYMAKNILHFLVENKDIEYAKSLYISLKSRYYLTENQIVGINKWIKNIKEMKEINGKWFFKK